MEIKSHNITKYFKKPVKKKSVAATICRMPCVNLSFDFLVHIIYNIGQKWRKPMGKNNEMQLWKRDHFECKIDKLLEPEIEREELKNKAIITRY